MPNLYFYIPADSVSKVIGLKGKHIKAMERDHRVTSRIFKEVDPFPPLKGGSTLTPSLWTAMLVSGTSKHVFGGERCGA
jgi:hypothetical protein